MLSAECVTGARIGELAGAQVGHGAFANHYSIAEWKGTHTSASGEIVRWDAPSGVAEGDRLILRTRQRDVQDGRAASHVRRGQDARPGGDRLGRGT